MHHLAAIVFYHSHLYLYHHWHLIDIFIIINWLSGSRTNGHSNSIFLRNYQTYFRPNCLFRKRSLQIGRDFWFQMGVCKFGIGAQIFTPFSRGPRKAPPRFCDQRFPVFVCWALPLSNPVNYDFLGFGWLVHGWASGFNYDRQRCQYYPTHYQLSNSTLCSTFWLCITSFTRSIASLTMTSSYTHI